MKLSPAMRRDSFVCKFDALNFNSKGIFNHGVNSFFRTDVDTDRQTCTILSPEQRPLPNTLLLLSEIQFMDSH